MRERLLIFVSFLLIVGLLVGLNAASFVRTEREPDEERRPNRSTFNAGATGTRAFYDFLRESGKSVTRWQEKPAALLDKNRQQPKTFVVVGNFRRDFEEKEVKDLLTWTRQGGRLVIIDREPDAKLLPRAGAWRIGKTMPVYVPDDVKPENVNQMTNNVKAAKFVQPTALSALVDSAMPSRFATNIIIERVDQTPTTVIGTAAPPVARTSIDEDDEPPPPPKPKQTAAPMIVKADDEDSSDAGAPVVHLASGDKTLLVDYAYGAGRIVYLSDPYLISNGGVELVDNLQLGLNVVGRDGLIAFDEYHHGFGATGNAFANFFEGTPLVAIALQLGLLVVFFVYTQGRRFARAVPLPNPDRRSKLEYVGAMAELQRQTRAFDLAIENIYGRVRRNLARFVGVDNVTTTSDALAARVAERSKLDKNELTNLFRECEDVIAGEKINDRKALALAARLREIEQKLGLQRNPTQK